MLPNLSHLSIGVGPDRKSNPSKDKKFYAKGPRKKRDVYEIETLEKFHWLLNNCAAYVLRIFDGFAQCTIGPVYKYMPTRCRPVPDSGADLPDEAERQRVVQTFLKGIPANIRNFHDLSKLVETQTFTAFVLVTYPNAEKQRWNTTTYHALVGLLFEDGSSPFGVTFGAVTYGALTEGSCASGGTSCDAKNMVVVLGDQIASCARAVVPRQMHIKARVPGEKVRDRLLEELNKLKLEGGALNR